MESAGAFLLFRVDDRLLHGQVALGWGRPLRARAFLIADDDLARDAQAALLYEAAAPEGAEVRITLVAETDRAIREAQFVRARTILIVRGLAQAAALLRAGLAGPVNLGGIHLRPGAREFLPYLFLTPEDESLLRDLIDEGHALHAQDLPGNPRHEARDLLSRHPSSPAGPPS